MKKVKDLKAGDYIAFGFNFNGGNPNEIIVSNITSIKGDAVLCHFMYGHHSLGEFTDKKDIIAIGNPEGKGKIKGWRGNFDILQPEHILLKEVE